MAAEGNGEALRVEHIAKRFGGITALADVNLRLAKGELLGLIGDNGAGKSTLIKIIGGFHQPDAGRLFILQHGSITFDKPTSQTSVQELTDLVVAEYRAARTAELQNGPGDSARPAPRP